MKTLYTFFFAGVMSVTAYAQVSGWNVRVEEKTLTGWNGAQSFSTGTSNGEWLVLGGRVDGLHQRHPFSAFLASEANHALHVIDPSSLQHWSMPVDSMSSDVQDQLLSTNMQAIQLDSMLYLMGGYGFSTSISNHSTFGRITAVHVADLIAAIKSGNGAAARAAVVSQSDARFAWTGGVARELDGTVYLAGGHYFHGLYNPMGPTHGPGFSQTYHDGYSHFELGMQGDSIVVSNYAAVSSPALMHRRDYNMTHRIDPTTGDHTLTAYSGVFQPTANLPWHDLVDLDDSGLALRVGASQLLNQYHSAHFALYDSANAEMVTVFLGGIGEYLVQSDGTLIQDPNVPFTKHVSAMVETSNGTSEYYLGDLPDFLGAGAEFLPVHPGFEDEILHESALPSAPNSSVLIGYMLGGIRSTAPNIFFSNGSNLSTSNTKLYEVWLDASGVGLPTEVVESTWAQFDSEGRMRLGGNLDALTDIWVYDATGRVLFEGRAKEFAGGLALSDSINWAAGSYVVRLESGESMRAVK
ncbi:MAG: hypothetical protein RL168_554 [Bacteroidota bacterium]